MTFVIRTSERSLAGREIVRERRVDAATLTIGRGPASDLVLPDLLLALDHARLERSGGGVAAVATAGLPIEVNGASVDRTMLDLVGGSELLLGAHRVTVRGDADGDVVVEVARVGDLSHASGDKDERTLFALAPRMIGKRPLAWAMAVAIAALFLVWPIYAFLAPEPIATKAQADAAWSPGPLSSAHAALEGDCKACHQEAFVAVRDESCRSCHTRVHDHADPARLVQAMPSGDAMDRLRVRVAIAFGRPPGRCADCHTEHQGAVDMAPTPQRFCTDCHGSLKERLPDTQVPDAGDFADAHPRFRPTVPVATVPTPKFRRIHLDGKARQDDGLVFPHAMHLSSTNAVAQMALRQGQVRAGNGLDCAGCHRPDVKGGFAPVSMEADCQGCHSLAFAQADGTIRTLRHGDPKQVVAELRDFYRLHGPVRPAAIDGTGRRRPGDFVRDSMAATYGRALAAQGNATDRAIRAVFQPGGACADCHRITPPAGGGLDYRIAPVVQPNRYLLDGRFDHRAHQSESCASCHAAPTSRSADDVLLPDIATCRTCHAGNDPKRGQVKSTCAMCHSYHQMPATPVRLTTAADPRRAEPPLEVAWR